MIISWRSKEGRELWFEDQIASTVKKHSLLNPIAPDATAVGGLA
jgi:hypothetical protein